MSDSDGDLSMRASDQEDSDDASLGDFSDDDDGESDDNGVVYVSSDDDETKLPTLLGGSSRRPRTLETYRAPVEMRNSVYRCKEFPAGVYINNYGELCPSDSRSGIFQKRKRAEVEDDDVHEEDVYHEVRNSTNKRRRITDDDEDWDDETEEEEDDEEDSSSEVDEIEDDDEEKEPEELVEGQAPLTEEQKRSIYMQKLHSDLSRTDAMETQLQRSRQQMVNAQKLNERLGEYEEEWRRYASKKARGIKFCYESKFVTDDPSCEIRFVQRVESSDESKRAELRVLHRGRMNCVTKQMECPCTAAFGSVAALFTHMQQTQHVHPLDVITKEWDAYATAHERGVKFSPVPNSEEVRFVRTQKAARGGPTKIQVLHRAMFQPVNKNFVCGCEQSHGSVVSLYEHVKETNCSV